MSTAKQTIAGPSLRSRTSLETHNGGEVDDAIAGVNTHNAEAGNGPLRNFCRISGSKRDHPRAGEADTSLRKEPWRCKTQTPQRKQLVRNVRQALAVTIACQVIELAQHVRTLLKEYELNYAGCAIVLGNQKVDSGRKLRGHLIVKRSP